MGYAGALPHPPIYIAILYIFKDSECQLDCGPTSKIFKGGDLYVPGGLHNLLYTWILVLSRLMPTITTNLHILLLTKADITYIIYSYE